MEKLTEVSQSAMLITSCHVGETPSLPRMERSFLSIGLLMVALSFVESDGFTNLDPKARFEILFGERTESSNVKPTEKMLWVNLCELYKNRLEVKRVAPGYLQNVGRVLRRFTEFCNLWNARIDQIESMHLQNYVSERSLNTWAPPRTGVTPKQLSPVTINNEIAILNSIFSYAGPRMPIKGHRDNLHLLEFPPYYGRLDEPEPCPVSVSEKQLAAFIDSIKFASSPRPSVCDPQLFWLAALVLDSITALRRAALLSVVRPDPETLCVYRRVEIPAKDMKNKRAEIITLGTRDDVVELLSSLPSRVGEPLLPWRRPDGRPLSLNHFNRVMKHFQRQAGIEDGCALRTKHLRSTAATEILESELSPNTARKRLGHKSERVILNNYAARRISPSDQAASDLLADRVMSIVGRSQPQSIRMA